MTPQEHQLRHYPAAMTVRCPVCIAPIGEPCMPVSCDRPHLDRCRQAERRVLYGWRLAGKLGGHLLEPLFATPAEAGEWRRRTYGQEQLPLTLVSVIDGEPVGVVGWELAEGHSAWQQWEAA